MKSSETDHKTTDRAQAPHYIESVMKRMTPAQLELAKSRAAIASATLQGDADRAEEFDRMSVEEYAAERGIEIVNNPDKGENTGMAKTNEDLQRELEEAYERIDELEAERQEALSAVAEAYRIEIFDPGDGFEDDDTGFDDEDSEEE